MKIQGHSKLSFYQQKRLKQDLYAQKYKYWFSHIFLLMKNTSELSKIFLVFSFNSLTLYIYSLFVSLFNIHQQREYILQYILANEFPDHSCSTYIYVCTIIKIPEWDNWGANFNSYHLSFKKWRLDFVFYIIL